MLPASGGIFGIKMSSPLKQIVDPTHRLIYNSHGTYALLTAPTSPETELTTAGWNALDGVPGRWKEFSESGTVKGTVGSGSEGKVHPAGVVALKVTLKENETREFPFAVAWHTPRFYSLDGAEYGHYYEKSFDDAVEAGRYALENRQSFLALLDEWQNRILRSSLPGWFTREVMNDAAVLFTNTILTKNGGLGGTEPGPFRFGLIDRRNASGAQIGALDRRYLAHSLLLNWFPALDDLELNALSSRQSSSGALQAALGDLEQGFSSGEVAEGSTDSEVVASYAFQVLRRHRWTGDQKFLDRYYPSVKHAIQEMARKSGGTRAASPPEDVSTQSRNASRLKSALLRRAAFKMAEELAVAMQERGFEAQCREWASKAEAQAGEGFETVDILRASAPAAWMLLETAIADDLPARYASLVRTLSPGDLTPTTEGPRTQFAA